MTQVRTVPSLIAFAARLGAAAAMMAGWLHRVALTSGGPGARTDAAAVETWQVMVGCGVLTVGLVLWYGLSFVGRR